MIYNTFIYLRIIMHFTDDVVHSYEVRLFEYNSSIWGKTDNRYEESILVLHSLPKELNYCCLECMSARVLFRNGGYNFFGIQGGEYRKSVMLLDESYGVKSVYVDWDCCEMNSQQIDCFKSFMYVFKLGNRREAFDNLSYRGICFGEVLHDELLRKWTISIEDNSIEDEKSIERCFAYSYAVIDCAFDFFENYKCKNVVIGEWSYIFGLFARVGQEFGAKIHIVDILAPSRIAVVGPDHKLFEEIRVTDIIRCKCDIANLEFGKNCGDFLYEREDYPDFNVKNEKNSYCAFILPHAFIDSPRTGEHMDVFFDYYEWFFYTLNEIARIDDVTWYIKDHPESAYYHQEGVMSRLSERIKGENIIWVDKRVSGEQIASMADCVITCAGDAGIEYWAKGIPTITSGKGYYVNWGISYNASSIDEYKTLLLNIKDLKKPSLDSMVYAQKKLMCSSFHVDLSNHVVEMFNNTRRKQLRYYTSSECLGYDSVFYSFVKLMLGIYNVKDYYVIGSDRVQICPV